MFGRDLMGGLAFVVVCALSACFSAEVTRCPDVDCPVREVCDNRGGCAFPAQLAQCLAMSDGTSCSYDDQANHHIDGACSNGLCLPINCGDHIVTPGIEVCDDGNNTSGDGCSADCQSLEICGNKIIDSAKGEQCDDGNTIDADGCQHNCLLPRCGDGVKDTALGEACDTGPLNSNAPDAACRLNCQLPRCGDGVRDPLRGEVCDDGNNVSADGCSGDCKSNETCGNRIVDALAGEVCDDGNTIGGDGCSANCRSTEVCGNFIIDTARGEVCDDGNTVSGDGCSSDCRSLEVCGNGIIDTINEQCDLGAANSNAADSACRTNCKLPRCGDLIVDPLHGEQCDTGVMNANAPDKCRTSCLLPRCGDGIIDVLRGEVCDDGNTISGDGCSSDCRSLETCGNSIIDTIKGEQCDNGAANSNAANATCRTSCLRQKCGDTIIDTLFGESCDLGASNSNAPNAICRANCTPQRCGDGVLDNTKGEVCDDGNVVSGDGCSADCKSLETCGNSIIDAIKGEQCDAGAANSNSPNAPCRTSCLLPKCGDSIIDPVLNEICDLGAANSNSANAACRINCQPQRCGDLIIDTAKGEVCDDGNSIAGDGCSPDCRSNETCGNGVIDAIKGEQCDAGAANSNNPNAPCRLDCKLPRCGDTVVDTSLGEICDLGAANSNSPNATCRTNCQLQRCGDLVLDNTKGEVCDDGNVISGDGCSADCKSNETCGNGIIDVAKLEQCDNGAFNSDNANATCRVDCSRQRCGDAIVDTTFGETCDLGAANSNAPNATCRTSCTPQRCGDGILDAAKGEVCDDGNVVSGDGCSADCKSLEVCGNAIVDFAKLEQCDDGNLINNDGCHNNCTLPRCGDGVLDFNEQCDAGAANSNAPNAACRTNCVPARCGDLIVDNLKGEVCDDGNAIAGDGCSPDCRSNETCGNGVIDLVMGESCDDANQRGRDGCSRCQPETAVVLAPGRTPPAREAELIVYDAGRQRVVMFGGWTPAGDLADTWEWDGVAWTEMHPKHSPAPRLDPAGAYDATRHRIVLFGGFKVNYGDPANDTWEYDGVDWTQKFPGAIPQGRAQAAAAYDANRKQVIMFGGTFDNNFTDTNETWAWDGVNWTLLAPVTKPPNRWGARMAFDSTNNYVLMWGGGQQSATVDTRAWTFNGTTWTDRGNAPGPMPGSATTYDYGGNGIAFDASIGKVVAFGQNGTFEWSGVAWTSIAGTNPTTPRYHVQMAYDAIRKQIVMFGGAKQNLLGCCPTISIYGDFWVRTGQVWSQPAAFTEPPPRLRAAAAYDPLRKRTVLFGGQNGATSMLADTWEWDGHRWQSMAPATPPAVRENHWLDYDSNARAIRLYGGDSHLPADTYYTDVYTYSPAAWTAVASTGRAPVKDATMSYDANTNKLVTFGGVLISSGLVTNQTWAWDATTGWAQANPVGIAASRDDSATAYDVVRKRTVLFSGNPRNGGSLVDIGEWDGANWTVTNPVGGPGPRSGHRLVYNPDAARVCVYGNSGLVNGEDLWEWNGGAWKQRPVVGTAISKSEVAIAYDAANHELVTFSGGDQGGNGTAGTLVLQYLANGPVESCTSAQLDYDNDGKLGCADEECWSVCSPLCPPGAICAPSAPRCGDGTCNTFEDCNICPTDCGACIGTCGDFHCDGGETAVTCPNDC